MPEHIILSEQHLLNAMLTGNTEHLDCLLHDNLLFLSHTGTLLDKTADLEAHRSGTLKINSLKPGQTSLKIIDITTVLATVDIDLEGQYAGENFGGHFRYLRVWKVFGEDWKVIAASASSI